MPSCSNARPFANRTQGRRNHSAPAPRRRMRVFRKMDQEQMVQERTALLGCFLGSPQDIARALRDARKAAMSQHLHYDPARHAALVRLARGSGASRAALLPGDGKQRG